MKIQLDQKAFTAWFESMDKEAQIELSSNIMNKFAESYLKPLIHTKMIKDMEQSIRSEIFDYRGNLKDSMKKEFFAEIKGSLAKELMKDIKITDEIKKELNILKYEFINFFELETKDALSRLALAEEKYLARFEDASLAMSTRLEEKIKNLLFNGLK